jgi:hypothetical protein
MQSYNPDFEAKMKFGSQGYELNGNLGKERVSLSLSSLS